MDAQADSGRSPGIHAPNEAGDCGCSRAPRLRSRGWHAFEYPETGGTEMRYAVVIEKTETGYSAYVPDLPGCVSVGRTREEMDRNIREAIELYLDELREQGAPIPAPTTDAEYIAVQRRTSRSTEDRSGRPTFGFYAVFARARRW